MKATDFRVGNILNWQIGSTVMQGIVTSLSTVSIVIDHKSTFKFKENQGSSYRLIPIPLTEEWMMEFGFCMIDHSGTHFVSKTIEQNNGIHPELYIFAHFKDDKMIDSGIVSGEIDNEYDCESERVHLSNLFKYVHQLQNLYYALTGQEL